MQTAIVYVNNGRIRIRNYERRGFSEPATKAGAKKFGIRLAKRKVDWICSSSVHHANEYGGSRADIAAAIVDGFASEIGKMLDKKIANTARKHKISPTIVQSILTDFGFYDDN